MLLSVTTKADSYLQFFTVLLLFVFVLAITWFVTRWIANYQRGMTVHGNLEVIDTCRVAPNKYVQIVRVGSRYLVIAIGKDEVHMLAELGEDELEIRRDVPGQTAEFASILEKVRNLKEKGKDQG